MRLLFQRLGIFIHVQSFLALLHSVYDIALNVVKVTIVHRRLLLELKLFILIHVWRSLQCRSSALNTRHRNLMSHTIHSVLFRVKNGVLMNRIAFVIKKKFGRSSRRRSKNLLFIIRLEVTAVMTPLLQFVAFIIGTRLCWVGEIWAIISLLMGKAISTKVALEEIQPSVDIRMTTRLRPITILGGSA